VHRKKAQQIYYAVLNDIKGLKTLTIENEEIAREYDWVENKWGRRRHIPDMKLVPYEIKLIETKIFDRFFDSKELGVIDDIERIMQQYLGEMSQAKWYMEKKAIKE